jgi:hypothetical protein
MHLNLSCSRKGNKCNNYKEDFVLYPIVLEQDIFDIGVVQLYFRHLLSRILLLFEGRRGAWDGIAGLVLLQREVGRHLDIIRICGKRGVLLMKSLKVVTMFVDL